MTGLNGSSLLLRVRSTRAAAGVAKYFATLRLPMCSWRAILRMVHFSTK